MCSVAVDGRAEPVSIVQNARLKEEKGERKREDVRGGGGENMYSSSECFDADPPFKAGGRSGRGYAAFGALGNKAKRCRTSIFRLLPGLLMCYKTAQNIMQCQDNP